MALFISLEGGEGSGKSVQANKLQQRLQLNGFTVIPVHEPGTTKLGNYLRKWLKSEKIDSHEAELLLFAAARSELVTSVIKPHLAKARTIIVADRYADSTTAYQGYGRGLKLEHVHAIHKISTQGIWPDLTLLLDLDPETGLARLGHAQQRLMYSIKSGDRLDDLGQRKFEELSLTFHKRIRQGYLRMAKAQPQRWSVVDASHSVDEVETMIWEQVQPAINSIA